MEKSFTNKRNFHHLFVRCIWSAIFLKFLNLYMNHLIVTLFFKILINKEFLCYISDTSEHLLLENQRLQEEKLCKICMDAEMDTLFLPCGHLCSCGRCAKKLRECPVCKKRIRILQKIFKS